MELTNKDIKFLYSGIEDINCIEDTDVKEILLELLIGIKTLGISLNVDEQLDITEGIINQIIAYRNDDLYVENITKPLLKILDYGVGDFACYLSSISDELEYDFCTIIEALAGFAGIIEDSDISIDDCDCDYDCDYDCDTSVDDYDTGYYAIEDHWGELQDIIEDRNMNYSQGNILKTAFCFSGSEHIKDNYEKDLNKIIYFAQREIDRINN